MKALKKLAVFCVGAALTVGSAFGFAACDNGTDPQGYDDPNIREVYSLYVASAEESGNEPMTYEEWLASIKGEDGAPGENGKDGSSFLHGEGAPEAADGKAGDLYLDVLTGDLYEKDANGWSADPVGNLKGPQGEQGPKGDKGDSATSGEDEPSDALKTYENVTINASGEYTLDVTGIEDGYYWLIAETETTAAANVLTVNSYGSSVRGDIECAYDMYSSTTHSFKGIVMVGCEGKDIKVHNTSSGNITATLKLVEYAPVTITAGTEIEVPCIPATFAALAYAQVPVSIDESLGGQSAKVTFPYWGGTAAPSVRKQKQDTTTTLETLGKWSPTDKEGDTWSKTLTMPESGSSLFIENEERTSLGYNVVIKIERAS